jgi:hypothetical protein
MENQDDKSKLKENSLSDFIETNHKLLTILGVFTALTVFSFNLPIKQYGYGLSFILFALTLLVWLEVWSKFPSGPGSFKLIWFENLLSFLILGIFLYWLLDFRGIWKDFLVVFLFVIFMSIFSLIMKKYDVFNRLFNTSPGKRKNLRYFLGLIIIITLFSISWKIAFLISPPVNSCLDSIYKTFQTPIP